MRLRGLSLICGAIGLVLFCGATPILADGPNSHGTTAGGAPVHPPDLFPPEYWARVEAYVKAEDKYDASRGIDPNLDEDLLRNTYALYLHYNNDLHASQYYWPLMQKWVDLEMLLDNKQHKDPNADAALQDQEGIIYRHNRYAMAQAAWAGQHAAAVARAAGDDPPSDAASEANRREQRRRTLESCVNAVAACRGGGSGSGKLFERMMQQNNEKACLQRSVPGAARFNYDCTAWVNSIYGP